MFDETYGQKHKSLPLVLFENILWNICLGANI